MWDRKETDYAICALLNRQLFARGMSRRIAKEEGEDEVRNFQRAINPQNLVLRTLLHI
jgi:hypothetical protein